MLARATRWRGKNVKVGGGDRELKLTLSGEGLDKDLHDDCGWVGVGWMCWGGGWIKVMRVELWGDGLFDDAVVVDILSTGEVWWLGR